MADQVEPAARMRTTVAPVLRSSSHGTYSLPFRIQPSGRAAPYGLPAALR